MLPESTSLEGSLEQSVSDFPYIQEMVTDILPENMPTLSSLYHNITSPVDTLQYLKGRNYAMNFQGQMPEGASDVYPEPDQRLIMDEMDFEEWYAAMESVKDSPELLLETYMLLADAFPGAVSDKHVNSFAKFGKTMRERIAEGSIEFKFEHLLPKEILKEFMCEVGAVLDIGWYWNMGRNLAADTVIPRIKDGKLQRLATVRNDTKAVSQVGGMRDAIVKEGGVFEVSKVAGVREIKEETTMTFAPDQVDFVTLVKDALVIDPRMTILTGVLSDLIAIMPRTREDMEQLSSQELVAQESEVSKAYWQTIDMNLISTELNQGIPGHAYFDLVFIKYFEHVTGLVVAADGTVYRRPTDRAIVTEAVEM